MACCEPVVTITSCPAPNAGEPAVPGATSARSSSRPSVGPYWSATGPVGARPCQHVVEGTLHRAVGSDSGAGSPPASESTPGAAATRSRSLISELRTRSVRRARWGRVARRAEETIRAHDHAVGTTGRAQRWWDPGHQDRQPRVGTTPRPPECTSWPAAPTSPPSCAPGAPGRAGDVGLEPGPRRRTPGLRREEVALLAGVSVSWYTWLEQGRPINASVDVLDALARALRMDAVERAHLLELAGRPTRHLVELGRDTCPPGVLELLRSVEPAPVFALGPTWDMIAWNDTFLTLFPPIAALPADECNLVWILFAIPEARALNGAWEDEARRTLSQYRAEVTPMRDDPAVATLVARLREASAEFREWWPQYDVATFESHRRVFNHARAGRLVFDSEQFVPVAAPDVRVVVHLPVEGDDSVARLAAIG